MKLPGRGPVEPAAEPETTDTKRKCPECGTPVSQHASTCAMCGYDFVAAHEAEQLQQVAAREEAAQRPVRAIAIGITGAVVILLIAVLLIRNRADAITALTPTITPTHTSTSTPTRTPSPTPTLPFTVTPIPPGEYTVQPGDTLSFIADLFEIDIVDLLQLNGLTENSLLQVSQVILIPPPSPTPTLTPTPRADAVILSPTPVRLIHVVQPDESIIAIAEQYDVDAQAVLDANDISDPDLIRVGDQLIIPFGSPSSVASGAATPTPLPNYEAVTLLLPLHESHIVGNSIPVLLQWLSMGILANEETYRITVEQVGGSIRHGPIFIKATGLHLPIELFPPADDPNRTFEWTVTVVRQVGVGNDGNPVYNVISPSIMRHFDWLPTLPTPTLTPEPDPL